MQWQEECFIQNHSQKLYVISVILPKTLLLKEELPLLKTMGF